MEVSKESTAATLPGRISTGYAISIGTLWVNIPVLAIMLAGWAALIWILAELGDSIKLPAFIFPVLFGLGPPLTAWIWWSLMIPRWRIWVLERTDDWPSVEGWAISVGLIWDENTFLGKLLARTEIWTASQRRRAADLRLHHRISLEDL
jgi:hypothetical protein